MSQMRIAGCRAPIVHEPVTRLAAKPTAAEEPRAPKKAKRRSVIQESSISWQVSALQPPKMQLSTLTKVPTSVPALFGKDLEAFEARSADDVAADRAETYIGLAALAKRQNDGDLMDVFDEMGELMRGFAHLRRMRTGREILDDLRCTG